MKKTTSFQFSIVIPARNEEGTLGEVLLQVRPLRRQLYNYSKGIVCHHLTTLFRDHDLRTVFTLTVGHPLWFLRRIKEGIFCQNNFPIYLILVEIMGNLAGPWALWRSRRRVKRQGRSQPYTAVSQHSAAMQTLSIIEEPLAPTEIGQLANNVISERIYEKVG